MPSEEKVRRAKVILKIDALEQEFRKLNAKLSEMESVHEAAWKEYGSEVCSGEMQANERNLLEKILKIRTEILLLNDYLRGKIKMEDESGLGLELQDVVGRIDALNRRKDELEISLRIFSNLRSLIS